MGFRRVSLKDNFHKLILGIDKSGNFCTINLYNSIEMQILLPKGVMDGESFQKLLLNSAVSSESGNISHLPLK